MKRILFVGHESYQQGVIGLIAGRLVEEFYRPAIVLSIGEKVSKASVRSVKGFNIIEFLRNASDLLVDVGGHPMAAGFTVETKNIEALQKKLEEMAETLVTDLHLERRLRIDCELPLSAISWDLYHAIEKLSPFGMGNPEPTFVSKNVEIRSVRTIGKLKNHLKMVLQEGDGRELDAIAFGMSEKIAELKEGSIVNVVYTIDSNTWNGDTSLQLKVKDIK